MVVSVFSPDEPAVLGPPGQDWCPIDRTKLGFVSNRKRAVLVLLVSAGFPRSLLNPLVIMTTSGLSVATLTQPMAKDISAV